MGRKRPVFTMSRGLREVMYPFVSFVQTWQFLVFKAGGKCVGQKHGGREVQSTRRNLKVNLCRLLKAQENPAEMLVLSFCGGQLEALRKFQSSAIEQVKITIKMTEIAAAAVILWTADIYGAISRCRLLWSALNMHNLI